MPKAVETPKLNVSFKFDEKGLPVLSFTKKPNKRTRQFIKDWLVIHGFRAVNEFLELKKAQAKNQERIEKNGERAKP